MSRRCFTWGGRRRGRVRGDELAVCKQGMFFLDLPLVISLLLSIINWYQGVLAALEYCQDGGEGDRN